jgi:hypothetical protein
MRTIAFYLETWEELDGSGPRAISSPSDGERADRLWPAIPPPLWRGRRFESNLGAIALHGTSAGSESDRA